MTDTRAASSNVVASKPLITTLVVTVTFLSLSAAESQATKVPAGAAEQFAASVPPTDGVVYPGAHWAQDSAAWLGWYLAAAQLVHKPVAFPSKYLPLGHAKHMYAWAEPVLDVEWPDGHCKQAFWVSFGWFFPPQATL